MNFLSLISSPFVWLLSKSTALAVKMTGVDTKEENRGELYLFCTSDEKSLTQLLFESLNRLAYRGL